MKIVELQGRESCQQILGEFFLKKKSQKSLEESGEFEQKILAKLRWRS